MNELTQAKRAQLIAALVERAGTSSRSLHSLPVCLRSGLTAHFI